MNMGLRRRAWTTITLDLAGGDTFDIALPDSARPVSIVIDHSPASMLVVNRPPAKPLVKLVLELDVTDADQQRRPRRFIAVPERTPFETIGCDFVCLFVNPHNDQRLALYELAYPEPEAVQSIVTELPGSGEASP